MSQSYSPEYWKQLLEYCESEPQRELIKAIIKAGGVNAGIASLNKDRRSLRRMLGRVKRKASVHGFAPDNDFNYPAPDTHIAKKVTIERDEETGQATRSWTSYALDADQIKDQLQCVAEEMCDLVRLKSPRKVTLVSLSTYRPRTSTTTSLDAISLDFITVTQLSLALFLSSWQRTNGKRWGVVPIAIG